MDRRIVDIQLERVRGRLKDRRISINLDNAAKDTLARDGYDPAYGARPLKRAMQKSLVDPLARLLLTGDIKDGDEIDVSSGKGGLTFKAAKKKESKSA